MANLMLHKGFMLQAPKDNPDPWLEVIHQGSSHPHGVGAYWRLPPEHTPEFVAGVVSGHDSEFFTQPNMIKRYMISFEHGGGSVGRRTSASSSVESLERRLANANDYFRRKATEVVNDESALGLLDSMFQNVIVEIADFDFCENGMALAKLTAANFAEIGANVIYITEAGQRFLSSMDDSQPGTQTK